MDAQTVKMPEVARARVPLYEGEPRTLAEVFERAAREHDKPDALNYKRSGAWRSVSSKEMIERARRIALGLYSLGIRPRDRVAILSENCPEWTLADAGCILLGAPDVPIYSTLTRAQARYILKDSGARALFIKNIEKYEQLKDALTDCAELEHVILFD